MGYNVYQLIHTAMFKRTKYSIENELQRCVDERYNLLEEIDELQEDFSTKERNLTRDIREYRGLNRSYVKFLTTILPLPPRMASLPDFSPFKMALKTTKIPQQRYDEFERERRVRNEIMDEYRRDFMNQIIAVDLANVALNDAKSRLIEVRQKINILANSF